MALVADRVSCWYAGDGTDPVDVRGTRKFNQHKSAVDRAATVEGQRRAGHRLQVRQRGCGDRQGITGQRRGRLRQAFPGSRRHVGGLASRPAARRGDGGSGDAVDAHLCDRPGRRAQPCA